MLLSNDNSINSYSVPQKISFNLEGGLNGEYPLDLRATSSFLLYFQQLIDKSYCVISNKNRIRHTENNDYKIVVKNFTVGSLSSELMLIVEGTRLALPLIGLCNPKSIWDYTCNALDLASKFFTALHDKKSPTINIQGDNNTVIYQDNSGTHTEYPKAVYDIANKSIPVYRKMHQTLNNGNFSTFNAHGNDQNIPALTLSASTPNLFNEYTIIDESPEIIFCDILRFDKETLTGKLRLLDTNFDNNNLELPFQIIGNQNPTIYIAAMNKSLVKIKAIKEVSYASLTPKVKRVQIISLLTDEES
ncbi:hypothetical protein [Veillonella caviae]|uniref:hypothetical protein n=1 Tax=Veillonella caviae TaxID=248316 RepID=UPI002A9122E3|nr:hypothetical protein [Veillonella caviae]MDD7291499.1 hypothetical protein [Veillonella caviae]MDY5787515.1 hypothetical protein [Veillonella caviae]